MTFISKLNSYYNDKGIEIQEEELVSGEFPKGKTRYTAIVTIQVNTPDGPYGQPISTKFHAKNIEDAFNKADKELQREVKKFQQKMEQEIKQVKDEALAPKIITPD